MSDGARYRKVYPRLWCHPGFMGLDDGEKVLALYVLSGQQTNRLGLNKFSIATAAEDLGTVPETLRQRLARVCETFDWKFDATARVLFIPSWWRWNRPENQNVVKGALKDLHEIPRCGLIDEFARNTGTLEPNLQQTFRDELQKRLPQPSPNQDQDQDQDQENRNREQEVQEGEGTSAPLRSEQSGQFIRWGVQ